MQSRCRGKKGAGNRWQRTDGRGQMTDDRLQTADYRGQMSDDREQMTENRLQTTKDRTPFFWFVHHLAKHFADFFAYSK
jgi:hypothetical protein